MSYPAFFGNTAKARRWAAADTRPEPPPLPQVAKVPRDGPAAGTWSIRLRMRVLTPPQDTAYGGRNGETVNTDGRDRNGETWGRD